MFEYCTSDFWCFVLRLHGPSTARVHASCADTADILELLLIQYSAIHVYMQELKLKYLA